MHQCTQKKVDAIIAARPFTSWSDIVRKFQNNKFLDTELLNSAQVIRNYFSIQLCKFFKYFFSP